jgi:hypothetical protein
MSRYQQQRNQARTRSLRLMSTGRLYRAAGATGPQAEAAVPALDESRQRPRLTTAPADPDLSITSAAQMAPEGPRVHQEVPAEQNSPDAPAHPADVAAEVPAPEVATTPDEPRSALTPDYAHLFEHATPQEELHTPAATPAETQPREDNSGLRWVHVSFILITVALVLGAATVRFTGEFGLPAGGPFFLVVVLTALFTRFQDRWAPAVMAPIAWLAAVLGPGQFTISHTKSPLLDQALLIFQGLSDNALWVLGSVLAGAGVAIARNRRGS